MRNLYMARKRLSAPAIEKLEEIIGDGMTDTPESAVFGVVNTDKQIVRHPLKTWRNFFEIARDKYSETPIFSISGSLG